MTVKHLGIQQFASRRSAGWAVKKKNIYKDYNNETLNINLQLGHSVQISFSHFVFCNLSQPPRALDVHIQQQLAQCSVWEVDANPDISHSRDPVSHY